MLPSWNQIHKFHHFFDQYLLFPLCQSKTYYVFAAEPYSYHLHFHYMLNYYQLLISCLLLFLNNSHIHFDGMCNMRISMCWFPISYVLLGNSAVCHCCWVWRSCSHVWCEVTRGKICLRFWVDEWLQVWEIFLKSSPQTPELVKT